MSQTFTDALVGARIPIIMEVKMKDPEGAALVADRTVTEIVKTYETLGAPCISVVTGHWFGGSDELLHEVVAATDRPVLKKDFITNARHVAGARDAGASAVLLTARLLPGAVFNALVNQTLEAGMTPFVEITSIEELNALEAPDDCVIAVNNKDITRRERGEPDVERGLALLPAMRESGTRCAVSASGIDDPETAARLVNAGFSGLLIGAGLLRTSDPDQWIVRFRDLVGQSAEIGQ